MVKCILSTIMQSYLQNAWHNNYYYTCIILIVMQNLMHACMLESCTIVSFVCLLLQQLQVSRKV